ncbi:uncharacterized protein LOC109862800 isoform X2 [Pseudomyrmex gracilis]|uniref:uncharacterized protein LOC109862800 isoform X2 n=1 Tax=Pseudomyrmex gracilis TaxID=219809 RepID=UPI000994CF64|nr:uncharacterized protein LOC109862800 isoform X2 [Pseudomyrmex gracilis]
MKAASCDVYIILIANGLLTSRFLQYVERERLINTRGYFLLLYDNRLFRPELHYIWNRIVNVMFVRQYDTYKYRSGEQLIYEKIDLNTVYYPSRTKDLTTIRYIDTWQNGKLRYGNDHYVSKTNNLHGSALRVAVFEHIPAVTEASRDYYQHSNTNSSRALGIEFELLRVIAKAMNFKPNYYMPSDIASEKWGKVGDNDSYTGLLGEAIAGNADFFLGDLHYTIHNLNYLDLSTPYNTECLTFLTPESLTDNSWKLLILPFRVTIDTLAQLTRSSLAVGGWNEKSKEFFLTSSDPQSQEIGNKFELTENEEDAVNQVENGTFCYYESSYLLRHIRGKRIFENGNGHRNKSKKNTESPMKYNLHIMEECFVHMPIALGLEKNSPLKPHVDLWIRRLTEIGLVRKWLSDVMEESKINEFQQKLESEKALVNLRKLYGALIALLIGYFLSFLALIGEIIHWKYVVLKDPKYDKYHLDIFYKSKTTFKT